mmetsp:Transcript_59368/g.141869  ORF Transcript_59368/g.141869 Transcript_59368/m.141869 type:complete len:282 (+) Transcript_59368:676-1521(+)
MTRGCSHRCSRGCSHSRSHRCSQARGARQCGRGGRLAVAPPLQGIEGLLCHGALRGRVHVSLPQRHLHISEARREEARGVAGGARRRQQPQELVGRVVDACAVACGEGGVAVGAEVEVRAGPAFEARPDDRVHLAGVTDDADVDLAAAVEEARREHRPRPVLAPHPLLRAEPLGMVPRVAIGRRRQSSRVHPHHFPWVLDASLEGLGLCFLSRHHLHKVAPAPAAHQRPLARVRPFIVTLVASQHLRQIALPRGRFRRCRRLRVVLNRGQRLGVCPAGAVP